LAAGTDVPFPLVVDALAKLRSRSCIIDREAVCGIALLQTKAYSEMACSRLWRICSATYRAWWASSRMLTSRGKCLVGERLLANLTDPPR